MAGTFFDSGMFATNTVRGKLIRNFALVVAIPVGIIAVVLLLTIIFITSNQADDSAAQQLLSAKAAMEEQGKILTKTISTLNNDIYSRVSNTIGSSEFVALMAKYNRSPSIPDKDATREDLNSVAFDNIVSYELSFFTILDNRGRVITRATDPAAYGDDVFNRDYTTQKSVSPINQFVDAASKTLTNRTGLMMIPEDILKKELLIQANLPMNVDSKTFRPTEMHLNDLATFEIVNENGEKSKVYVGIGAVVVLPIVDRLQNVLGVVVSGKILARNNNFLTQNFHSIVEQKRAAASIVANGVRIASTESVSFGDNINQIALGVPVDEKYLSQADSVGSVVLTEVNTGATEKAYMQVSALTTSLSFRKDDPILAYGVISTQYATYGTVIEELQSSASTLFWISVLILIVSIALGFVGAIYFARNLSGSLTTTVDNLLVTMDRVAHGDFNARTNIHTGDEFEELGSRFDEMIRRLSALIETEAERDSMQKQLTNLLVVVSNSAEGDFTQRATVTEGALGALADSFNLMVDDLGRLIREVQSVTRQVSESAKEILASTEEMAHGAEEQSIQVTNASAAVEEMAASIRQVANNADSAAEAASKAAEVAQSGGNIVLETIEGMRRIRSTVQDSAQKIKSLGESSNEIGKIVQVIDEIASQTNLLALNATIEAARAGEAGRGFAVVADQVRELAERSAKATNDISQLVQTIQAETQEAVHAMEKGTAEVEKGTRLADEAARALEQIRSVVQQSTELIQEISLAAKQQDIASAGVVMAMNEVSQIAKQSLIGSRQSAASATDLVEITKRLSQSVARFKLPGGGELLESGAGAQFFSDYGSGEMKITSN
ncbi:MAG: methyl-accepting chemotaxis protein [Bacteroidetes bacterium]|nr:methyl-accepting chemotaxis protein [Bacteroidota bacterium]